ncbi:MAG TPA: hypothetical protein DCM08_13990 [Microscillaceae bacterium]|nr:hypothetical protein [Microscillaceae bacterium]
MAHKVVIQVENLSKYYRLKTSQPNQAKAEQGLWALREVGFSLAAGEALGIVGKNGSGKSTLLKLLAKITQPTTGTIRLKGTVSALLELGTGFHQDLNGYENILLNGAILGMKPAQVKARLDEIVAFAEVASVLYEPIKHYSSGMQQRLAFAVAAHLQADIVLIDEVLAVGDWAFQQRCTQKMKAMRQEGKTLLVVSHDLALLRNNCPKAILLEAGRIQTHDTTENVIRQYLQPSSPTPSQVVALHHFARQPQVLQEIVLDTLAFSAPHYRPQDAFGLYFSLRAVADKPFEQLLLGLDVLDGYGNRLFHLSNFFVGQPTITHQANQIYGFELPQLGLKPGRYHCYLYLEANGVLQDWITENIYFDVLEGNIYGFEPANGVKGMFQPPFQFLTRVPAAVFTPSSASPNA